MGNWAYVLHSLGSGHYYIGQTDDLDFRLSMHNGRNPHSYTSRYQPWVLGAAIPFDTRSKAMRAETYLKKKPRPFLVRIAEDSGLMDYITKRFGAE
jgi:putative endonuclease